MIQGHDTDPIGFSVNLCEHKTGNLPQTVSIPTVRIERLWHHLLEVSYIVSTMHIWYASNVFAT